MLRANSTVRQSRQLPVERLLDCAIICCEARLQSVPNAGHVENVPHGQASNLAASSQCSSTNFETPAATKVCEVRIALGTFRIREAALAGLLQCRDRLRDTFVALRLLLRS